MTFSTRTLVGMGFMLLAVLSLLNIWFSWLPVPAFGDGRIIAIIMFSPEQFPAAKYLVGMGLMRALYSITWGVPAFAQLLPLSATSLLGFIRVVGALLMLASTLLLLKVSRGAWRIVLAVTTPIWLLFSIGYIEYYPFIAGLFLAFLYWAFSRPLTAHAAVAVGAACSVLPLVYAGFAPYGLIVLAVYLYGAALRKIIITLAAATGAFLAVIWLFWAKGIAAFFDVLLQDLNLGEQNTVYAAYKGLASGSRSIFFSLDYVFSLRHMREILQMLFSGLGIVAIALIPVAVGALLWRRATWTRNDVLALLLAGWSLFYVLLMMPKLGPVQDLDLFFSSYLVLAFVAGMQVEKYSHFHRSGFLVVWLLGSVLSIFYIFRLAV